ncbi:MAG: hypothetical protein ACRDT2_06885 [Natronosporangium sp.]
MNRADLTARYLDELKQRGIRAGDLVDTSQESPELQIQYQGRYLSRPLFLGQAEQQRLHADVANLRSALVSLPDRLYGGDLAGFARALGMADVQVSAILRSRGTAVTQQSRADLYTDQTGFKLLEFNMGSAIGGIDNSDMCRMLLEHPVLAEFARTHRLGYLDTMREQVNNMLLESGFAAGSKPVMATTDWPSSFQTLEPFMRHFDNRLQELGIDAHPCHIGQLEVRDGRVWLGERPVDIIQRLFMLEDLLEHPDAAALMDPILDAAARGEVKIFTPMDAELFASKAALAMLSDEQHRSRFEPDELASIDRILPWTRMVRPGPVTLEDGSRVELLDYAIGHQPELALKPTLQHGGQGVLLGWRPDTSPELWQERVRAAVDEPYVLQRRIRPVPELFPTDDGEPIPWIVSWGVFTVLNGYGGVYARAVPVESDVEVINHSGGAYSGGCLHVLP